MSWLIIPNSSLLFIYQWEKRFKIVVSAVAKARELLPVSPSFFQGRRRLGLIRVEYLFRKYNWKKKRTTERATKTKRGYKREKIVCG